MTLQCKWQKFIRRKKELFALKEPTMESRQSALKSALTNGIKTISHQTQSQSLKFHASIEDNLEILKNLFKIT